MGSIFRPKMPPLPAVAPPPEPPKSEMSSEDKERIAKEQAAIRRRKKGRQSTIITGPLGIQEDKEEALETLLG
tara:strand:- start:256 stop:474 length:219 start_codon:yes stop_codon:yes gene_type:complete